MNIFSTLYEGGYLNDIFYFGEFSDDLSQTNAYQFTGLIMLGISFLFQVLYYYFISNYGNFDKKRFWLLWIIIALVINFFVAKYISEEAIYNFYTVEPFSDYHIEYYQFSMVNVLYTFIFSFLFSLILKIKSIKANRTPF